MLVVTMRWRESSTAEELGKCSAGSTGYFDIRSQKDLKSTVLAFY